MMSGQHLMSKKAAGVLKAGGVVMHSTETCYGLAADIFSEQALKKLYKIKKMRADKPVSIMVRSLAEAKKYARFNVSALKLAKKFWPGPLTLVLPRKKFLPDFLNKGHGTVGIRCPDSKISQVLIKAFRGPLTTTSANISGKIEVYSVRDYLKQLKEKDELPDLIIDEGRIPKNRPSTIIAFKKGKIVVMRKGDLWVKISRAISETV